MPVLFRNELSKNARGGTELMGIALENSVPPELLEKFQIFVSRVMEPLDDTKIRILWCHDLVGDPAAEHLYNGGWAKFHKIVFVSNWQMQSFINNYGIPWDRCVVIQNGIQPIVEHEKPEGLRLAYWSTPHRGLEILVPVFEKLQEKYPDLGLDVYSSFSIYGWQERDAPYEPLFERLKSNKSVSFFQGIDNESLRHNIKFSHILAYPSIWPETSCITLMEAMSAGLLCVHSNLGALSETAANWTMMYQYDQDINRHANLFYHNLDFAIQNYNEESVQSRLSSQKAYANVFYNWNLKAVDWTNLLTSLEGLPTAIEESKQTFVYRT